MAVSNILNFLNIGGVSPTGTSAQGENPRPKAQDGEVSSLPSDVDPRGLEKLASKEKTIASGDLPFPLAEASLTTEGDPPTDPIAEARALIRRKRDLRNDKIENERRIAGLEDDIEDINEEIGETEELAKKQELRGRRRELRSQIRDLEADNARIDSEIEAIDEELAILTSPPPPADDGADETDAAGGSDETDAEDETDEEEEIEDLDGDGIPDSVDADRDGDDVINSIDPDPDDPSVNADAPATPASYNPAAPVAPDDETFKVILLYPGGFRNPESRTADIIEGAEAGKTIRIMTTRADETIRVINRTTYIEIEVKRNSDGLVRRIRINPATDSNGDLQFGYIQINGGGGINTLKFEGFNYSTLHQIPDDYDPETDGPIAPAEGENVVFGWSNVGDLEENPGEAFAYPMPAIETLGADGQTISKTDLVKTPDGLYHIAATGPYILRIPEQIQVGQGERAQWKDVYTIEGYMTEGKRAYKLIGRGGVILGRIIEDNPGAPAVLVPPAGLNMKIDLSRLSANEANTGHRAALLKLIGHTYNVQNSSAIPDEDWKAIAGENGSGGWADRATGVAVINYNGGGALNVKLTEGNDLFMKRRGSFYLELGSGSDVAVGRGSSPDIQMYKGGDGADYLSGSGHSFFWGGSGADTIAHDGRDGPVFVRSEGGENTYRLRGEVRFSNPHDSNRPQGSQVMQPEATEGDHATFANQWDIAAETVQNEAARVPRPEEEE